MLLLLLFICFSFDLNGWESGDREVRLKTDEWVRAYEIPGMLEDIEALSAVQFYLRWKRMGMPYGPWGMNPNRLVEVIELLDPLDGFYHPRMI